jgi:hypothetical protein
MVGMSALLTTTMQQWKKRLTYLKMLNWELPIHYYWWPVTLAFAKKIGADDYAKMRVRLLIRLENISVNLRLIYNGINGKSKCDATNFIQERIYIVYDLISLIRYLKITPASVQ